MALPSSGPISLADVNVELGRSPTASINMNDADVRALAGQASGIVTLESLRGKSSAIEPQPYPSWTLDGGVWVAPTPIPTDGKEYYWDEPSLQWVEIPAL
jgi:hypothetical protein